MSDGLWLIMSGAFVNQELAAEFGQMPPSFLPLGNRRLYEYQIEKIGSGQNVYITVPETYKIPVDDDRRLAELGVVVLPAPEQLSLGEAIVFALNLIAGPDQSVRILHGDTLVDSLSSVGLDNVGIASSTEGYSWAEIQLDGDWIEDIRTISAGGTPDEVLSVACGVFTFSRSSTLVRSITISRGNFIGALLDYKKSQRLRAVSLGAWHDFGHVQTFFRSRRVVTSARHFNSLTIDGRTARKTSHDIDKIRAEASWLQAMPPKLKIFSARLVNAGDEPNGRAFYETEYSYVPTLAELFVFGSIGVSAWSNILHSCVEFLSLNASVNGDEEAGGLLHELAAAKTKARLLRFASEAGFDIEAPLRYNNKPCPSLLQIADDVIDRIDFSSRRPAQIMHGDFCFSNILYDSRTQRIHVIDPRGYVTAGRPSIYGDIRYDVAKLMHSVVGRYDQIIAGRYVLNAPDSMRFDISFEQAPHHAWLESQIGKLEIDGVRAIGHDVGALTVCLFLSMLPLHSDRPDRQRAFVANALRLHAKLEETFS